MLNCSLAFATSGGHDGVWASTVAVANTAIAKALIKAASSLFIAFLPIGLGGRLARTPMAPPIGSPLPLYDPRNVLLVPETIDGGSQQSGCQSRSGGISYEI